MHCKKMSSTVHTLCTLALKSRTGSHSTTRVTQIMLLRASLTTAGASMMPVSAIASGYCYLRGSAASTSWLTPALPLVPLVQGWC